ncbi:hypothetical protein CANCADRAFT_17782, partial [Tortispora caseinolytica NRRL Y-17796]
LPQSLTDRILDKLDPVDWARFAQVSRATNRITYRPNRWVYALRLIGAWNELKAREVVAYGTIFDAEIDSADFNDKSVPIPDLIDVDSPAPLPAVTHFSSDLIQIYDQVSHIPENARREFGAIYAVAKPLYDDAVIARSLADVVRRSKVYQLYNDPMQLAKALHILKKFSTIDKSSDDYNAHIEHLDAILELFENSCLAELETVLDVIDPKVPARMYIDVLVYFNGGSSAAELFARHASFSFEVLARPEVKSFIEDKKFHISHIKHYLDSEKALVVTKCILANSLFPTPLKVPQTVITNANERYLVSYFSELLEISKSQRETLPQLYLDSFSAIFGLFLDYCDSLASVKLEQNLAQIAYDQIVKVVVPSIPPFMHSIVDYMNLNCEGIIGEWDSAADTEQEAAESILLSNVSREKEKTDFLTSFKHVLMMPVTAISKASSSTPAASTNDLNGSTSRPQTPSMSTPDTSTGELPTTALEAQLAIMKTRLENIRSLFSIQLAMDLLTEARSSLERLKVFVSLKGDIGKLAQKNAERIFTSMLDFLGPRHVQKGFDKAIRHLDEYRAQATMSEVTSDTVSDPLTIFLELVNVGDLIQQLVDAFYEQELIAPRFVSKQDFLTQSIQEKRKFEQMLDESVATGLNKGIDVLIGTSERILIAEQLGSDYNPPVIDNSLLFIGGGTELGPTRAAQDVVQLLKKHLATLDGATEKSVLDVFKQEVGMQLFGLLCRHIKQQTISVAGAPIFMCDMNYFYAFVSSLRQRQLYDYFAALKTLGQLYLIDGEDSKEIGALVGDLNRFKGVFQAEELYEFAQRRADWPKVKREVEKVMYGLVECIIM